LWELMHFLDLTLPTLAENLALDEALLLEAEAGRGGEVLRVWEWSKHAVILGAGCRLAEDVDEIACQADGVPILRRASGGGTVLLGLGCLCYAVVLAYDRAPALREIRSSYAYVFERIQEQLADVLPNVEHAGISDLALTGRKFSGNSQQRKQSFLLHHGTLLYQVDLSRVGRYLRMPSRQPDYRQGREHGAFLMNVPLDAGELKQRLRRAWEAWDDTLAWPEPIVAQLVAQKYTTVEWVRRR
jgi:lipoate-protein ligase A